MYVVLFIVHAYGSFMDEEQHRMGRKAFARLMRKNMTPSEQRLWEALRNRKFRRFKFRRQVPIGSYTVDFLSNGNRLIVELDGPIHERLDRREYDNNRDECLRELGYRTLRFKNEEILEHLPSVLHRIDTALFHAQQTETSPLLRNPTQRKLWAYVQCSKNEDGEGG